MHAGHIATIIATPAGEHCSPPPTHHSTVGQLSAALHDSSSISLIKTVYIYALLFPL